MTDYSDFDQFAQDVQQKVSDLWDDAQDALGTMANILNDAAGAFDWKTVVFGPIGSAIIDGLTSDDVERAIDKFNNEIRPEVEDKLNELGGDVERVVSSMAGDPVGLKLLSFDYADCKAALLSPAPSIASEIAALGHHWTGDAFDNYLVAATEQVKAMEDIASALEAASDMTNLAGQKILQLWVDLVDAFVATAVDAISILSDATSVESIISFEVPVIISAIGAILAAIQRVAKILEDYMIGVGFPDQLEWRQLANGSTGLPNNTWPVLHPDAVDGMVTPEQWQVA
jgi:uncharacterized protein YukE